jgi:sec-independent protein translocase protein TatA
MPFVGGLGIWEVLLILVVVLIVFGPKRLPDLGGALGKGIREFKRSIRDIEGEINKPLDEERDLNSTKVRGSVAPPAAEEPTEQQRTAEEARQG